MKKTAEKLGHVILKAGGLVGSHGADVISYCRTTGIVHLWDAKWSGASNTLRKSATFTNARRLGNAVAQAKKAILSSSLSATEKAKALGSLMKKTFQTTTHGFGTLLGMVKHQ